MNVSILIDGSFFWMKHLEARLGQPPSADSVRLACDLIMDDPEFDDDRLFRAYYYDSPPYGGRAVHPISQREIEFSATEQYRIKHDYLDQLRRMPRMALRLGSLAMQGWKLNKKNMRAIMDSLSRNLPLQPQDVSINLVQKEVDMLMGLDIAWMAARGMVDKIVLLTGDADMIPAMNFAREHGLLVFVAKFGYYLSDKLRDHADGVVEFNLPAPERASAPAARVVSMPGNGHAAPSPILEDDLAESEDTPGNS
ncbi:NYN domain-containing protein [Fundidesulfovibrio terrae]|uniref:NYN domain-containing protein n=1 Tax=Fundidesulfovibrio terrae TaxID=2922866 RepID=UPI001FAECC3B|nr:NYN domain-containing protein [Fundidesulfovibrio terrae]